MTQSPVTKKVQRRFAWRNVSNIDGRGAESAPASKVRAIQGRSVLPRAISIPVTGGLEAGGRVGVGLGVSVTEGEGVAVNVTNGVELGVMVKVAVGKGVAVAVGGRNWEITGNSLSEEESQAGASNNRESSNSSKPLLLFKLQSPFNSTHYVAVGQVLI